MNIAILGAGAIAVKMAETVRKMSETGLGDVVLYAVASRDLSRARAFADRNGVLKAYGSYEEMLCDDRVDLVYIATPHSHHFSCMKLCIEHGKNVLCEKAFTVNAVQAREILALAEEKRVLVTEAIWPRYQPMRQIINETVDSGIVGEPKMIMANLFYAITNKERLIRPELAGGALLDLGVYPLNFAEMIFGRADHLQASCVMMPTGVDEQDCITLTWDDGRMAVLTAGASSIGDRRGQICCSEGFVVVDNINNPEKITVYDRDYRIIKEIPCPEQLTGYEYEVLEACEAIREGKLECASMPHEETIHMMELMDEARRQMGVRFGI